MGKQRIESIDRLQRVSGLVFLMFLVIHLINTYLAVLGPGVYDGYQKIVRAWYQNSLFEAFTVLVPLAVHIVCGVLKIRRSRGRIPRTMLRRRLHRYSGVFLTIVIFGHVVATRGASFFADIYPGFEGMAFTMQSVPAYFYPYYFLFASAAIYHAWYGVQSIIRSPSTLARLPFWLLPVFGSTLVAVSLMAFGGWLFPVDDAMNSDYAKFILRFFG